MYDYFKIEKTQNFENVNKVTEIKKDILVVFDEISENICLLNSI